MTPIRVAAAAAVIGVLAVIGSIVPRTPGPADNDLVASPSPSPSAVLLEGYAPDLPAGTYKGPIGKGVWTATMPEGWEDFYSILWKDVDGRSDPNTLGGPGEVALGWWTVANVFADPCHWKDSVPDPPTGPTVDDLVAAFLAQAGRDGSGPTDVVLGGLPAKRIELSVPADLDVTSCDDGVYWEFLDVGESLASAPDPNPEVSGEIAVLYILDIAGDRFMMRTWHRPDASARDMAEMEAILGSLRIDLPAPSPSPVPSPSAAG